MATGRPVRRTRRRALTILLVLVVAVAVVSQVTTLDFAMWQAGERGVGLVEIVGTIESEDTEEVVEAIKRFREADAVRAIVVRIDSPGGEAAPAQEIFEELMRARDTKPVVASLGNLAASGGYYVASACEHIVANPATLTGSIGVLMALPDVEQLLANLGVRGTVVKSGEYKDIGSPFRAMSEEEGRLMQELLDSVHRQFVAAVARGRGLEETVVRRLADGRVYSGEQAMEYGLADQLGGLEDAIALATERAGIEGEPKIIRAQPMAKSLWQTLLRGQLRARVPHWRGGFEFRYPGSVQVY